MDGTELTPSQWIAKCAARLGERSRTAATVDLEAAAVELWRDAKLRELAPEDAAAVWLAPMLDTDAPVALWLTPSDTVRAQTIEALADVTHPYRQALSHYFGDRVQVCDLETLQTISPHDVGKAAVIVVATIQSFNVTDTAKRNVYSFFEELAPHFDGLPPQHVQGLEKVTPADLASQPYLGAKDIGRVKYSVANWLHLQQPIVIVDEAHNNRTDRFFKTLGRVNPS